ncbi:putative Lipopolysaccharide N-acetylglucosaminyltransferase II [Pseudorhizobium banfieldiae]|uniref:Putative Lipopolysaccharide N-acetylglucosaminyltransferase II n=1 Tax=Pseudorhizobium banfieldiae TaxID=1125847 RepID=L0NDB6_9HYPH|nr:glycosyltransferase family 1 protein [Pseudorhizobium banfieldiae]CAD6601843.1 glycosyltransferase family 1 protein [arsenite-oxidising bacterium NT-25]CCF18297.1 putative Lipopolysaccharide N-acetylglucosaminyltransferase II [Pseudorhizobium banfieldiae]
MDVSSSSDGFRIWIEVDDFIRYFDWSVTPTGIGRVQAQILPWLVDAYPGRVLLCRVGAGGEQVEVLSYEEVARLTDGNEFLHRQKTRRWPVSLLKVKRYLGTRLTAAVKARLGNTNGRQRFASMIREGDVLLNLGASWSHRDFGKAIAFLKARYGVRFGLLVHDVLPVSHPHLVAPGHIPNFTKWLHDMTGVWDLVLTPSQSSAEALANYLGEQNLPVPDTRVIPFGAGFPTNLPRPDLPLEHRSHVLYVSTIEIRKNHMLLFRVWEKLVDRHGAGAVPQLVFAGKFGWEIADLRRALNTSKSLDGKIRVIENLSDEELASYYRNSLFTVFPSFCEGWGLPVSESLYYGRYCIASSATSLPEVGGRFIDYHEPGDTEGAYELIEAAIFNPDLVADKEQIIRQEYPCPTWQQTALSIVATLDGYFPDPQRKQQAFAR